MAIQRHPVDSYERKVNFWEEFADYKVHKLFGELWALNKKNGRLEASSKFMWALTLMYDRKSSVFPQPEIDKWEVVSEDLFKDSEFFMKLHEDIQVNKEVSFPVGRTLQNYIQEFEQSIDTPIGISLRLLEKKLAERTQFINDTKYTMDEYIEKGTKQILQKGTADQLDRMFANTDKINNLIHKALEGLISAEGSGTTKGGQKESLGDEGNNF